MAKSVKEKMKDALGIEPENKDSEETNAESDKEKAGQQVQEPKETDIPEQTVHRGRGRPPKTPAEAKPAEPPPAEPPKQGTAKQQQQPAQPQDPYRTWLDTNVVLSPDDVAVYQRGDGKVIVLTDALGRSILNVGLYLRKEVLDKVNSEKVIKTDK